MKHTAIVTWITYTNFGTYLQAYALQQYIKSLGYKNKILDDASCIHTEISWKYEVKKMLWSFTPAYHVYVRNRTKAIAMYEQFKSKYIDLEKHISDRYYLNSYYDCFICGSDQIWSPLFLKNPHADFYYASFASKKKIAYAPSIGVSAIPEELKFRYVQLIADFKSLSVREPQGQKNLQELTGNKVPIVVDPTLLLQKEDWEKLLPVQRDVDKYVLAYFLTPNYMYINYVQKYAETHGLKLKIFFTDKSYCHLSAELITAGPLEFLKYIRNAKFVFTDSFHGSIFASIFNVQFVTFKRFKNGNSINQNSRVENLLNMMGISEHLIDENQIENISNLSPINFEAVKLSLKPFIEVSKQYLQKALAE